MSHISGKAVANIPALPNVNAGMVLAVYQEAPLSRNTLHSLVVAHLGHPMSGTQSSLASGLTHLQVVIWPSHLHLDTHGCDGRCSPTQGGSSS
jgi:hypothetical protein